MAEVGASSRAGAGVPVAEVQAMLAPKRKRKPRITFGMKAFMDM
jgi:hypothetical protein